MAVLVLQIMFLGVIISFHVLLRVDYYCGRVCCVQEVDQFLLLLPAGDGLISLTELDPLGLHLPHARRAGMSRHLVCKASRHNIIIQVALIAETVR